MRAHPSAVAAALVLFASAGSLSGQESRFEGVWKNVGEHVATPDSNYDLPPLKGLAVIHGRYISQMFVIQPPNGIRQSGELRDAESKAARYDAIVATAGTFVLHEKTFIMHIIEAAQPELAGQSITREYRFRGDTLLIVDTEPWPKDKTKVSRTTLMFVRVPPK